MWNNMIAITEMLRFITKKEFSVMCTDYDRGVAQTMMGSL